MCLKNCSLSIGILLALICPQYLAASKNTSKKVTKGPSIKASKRDKPKEKYPSIQVRWSDDEKLSLAFSDLAFQLGLSQDDLEIKAKSLAELIDLKKDIPCDTSKSEVFCKMVSELKMELIPKAGSLTSGSKAKQRVFISRQNITQNQKDPYADLLGSLSKMPTEDTDNLVSSVLKTTGCPRNLSAALMRRTELSLPSEEAKKTIAQLYKHASHCLQENDEAYEVTHFRYALLNHAWGNKKIAKEAIDKAILSVESEERSRALFWAGYLQENQIMQDAYWTRLVDTFPLTYHALEVWEKKNVDPLRIFSSRPAFEMVRNALGSDMPADNAMRWLEALYFINKNRAALWLGDWVSNRYAEQLSSANTLYISKLKSQLNTPLSTIRFLSGGIRRDPMLLNEQSLRLLFPKHYFESFSKTSLNVDAFLLLALARQESAFDPRARSVANAQGIMQLLPATARRLNRGKRADLYNPTKNIELGSKFLGDLIERYGKVELALAAYNAGPNRIPQWQERYVTKDDLLFVDLIPFKETRNYVTSILRNNYWYERLYKNDPQITHRNNVHRSRNVQRLISSHFQASSTPTTLRTPAMSP